MSGKTQSQRFAGLTGYAFKDLKLFERALTHSSHSDRSGKDNERLEFLGDRVLALVIAEELHKRYPDSQEGDLARRLNKLVRKESCAQVARTLKLGQEMAKHDQKSKQRNNIFENQNVLGDACEAVLAAIYLDGGLEEVRKFILRFWAEMLNENKLARRDPKTALQEWALGQGIVVPTYTEISKKGPDHQPVFEVSVAVDQKGKATGTGPSKRVAEQEAANNLLGKLKIEY